MVLFPDGNRTIIPTRSPVDVGYVLYYLFIYCGLFNDTVINLSECVSPNVSG